MAENVTMDSLSADTMLSEDDLEELAPVYRTYAMDHDHGRIRGMIDGKDAVRQAIWKILSTRRFAYFLYDDQYGSDIFNKIGDVDLTPEYLDADIPAMVMDALLADARITGIRDFSYEIVGQDEVHIQFVAETIYGEMEMEGVLTNGDG